MNTYSGGCLADLGTLTLALKAQKLLGTAAIPSTVIKNSSSFKERKGCSYALRIAPSQLENVRKILSENGIRVREWKIQ